ncbi:MAG: hypothetical protein V4772_13985 [Pseudomonadota bacterium]
MTSANMIRGTTLAFSALVLCVLQAQAQGSPATAVTFQALDPCRAAVSRFEQTIGFIRQSQGNAAAAELKEKLLPAKTETAILFKDGYCGLAAYLREKKLDR